jgi:adenine deaminase
MTRTNLRMAIFFIAVLTAIIAARARTTGPFDTIATSQVRASGYDIVIANGRVMDPESGLDAVRNVGITAGKIRAVSVEPLKGKTVLDAKGLVVAPGFIDLHEHAQEPRNYQFQAHDGVTTSLELELGTDDVDR